MAGFISPIDRFDDSPAADCSDGRWSAEDKIIARRGDYRRFGSYLDQSFKTAFNIVALQRIEHGCNVGCAGVEFYFRAAFES